MKPIGFALHWPCDPKARSRSEKWHKTVEVKGAYKYGMHEKIWLNNLCVMSSIKVFATQVRQTDKHDSLYISIWYSYESILQLIVLLK